MGIVGHAIRSLKLDHTSHMIAMTGSHKRGETCRQHFTRCNLQGIVSHAIKSFEAGIPNILGGLHRRPTIKNLVNAQNKSSLHRPMGGPYAADRIYTYILKKSLALIGSLESST